MKKKRISIAPDTEKLEAFMERQKGEELRRKLENAFSDIRLARDFLQSQGYDVGDYTLNSITDAQYFYDLAT